MSFKNTKGQKENKRRYPSWVSGFVYKGQRLRHPYTEVGFKFDNEKK